MNTSAKDELTEVFDQLFANTQRELTGSEQEIVVLKHHARMWFQAGIREASAVFYAHAQKALTGARAEIDSHFAFLNNQR